MATLCIIFCWGFIDLALCAWREVLKMKQEYDHSIKTAKKIANINAGLIFMFLFGLIALLINFFR